jgi:4,5-dihydroxyphthalate decarboxylase
MQETYEHAEKVLGENFWPYGIEGNRRTLEAFLRYCKEQGVIQRAVSVEELFPHELSKTFRI